MRRSSDPSMTSPPTHASAARLRPLLSALALGLLLTGRLVAAGEQAPPPDPETLAVEIERLTTLVDAQPANAALAHALALAHNTLGVSLADQRRWDSSLEHFRQALALDPQNAVIERNVAQAMVGSAYALYNARHTARARRLLDQALRYPNTFEGLMLAGQLAYEGQRLKEAQGYWTKALHLQPESDEARMRLEQLARERPIEEQFDKVSQQFFELRFDAHLPQDNDELRGDLLEARRVVGQAFRSFPTDKIVVLVYTEEQFRQLHQDSPEWVGGQYDGKIRIPIRSQNRQAFRRILWHEYTHALVHLLSLNRCPTWLNEGLAEYEGATQQPTPSARLQAAWQASPKRLLDLTALSAAFDRRTGAEEASLAYEEARSFVGYLIERYGLWRLTRVLKRLGAGEAFDPAFTAELHAPLPTVYQRWLAVLPTLLEAPS